MIKKVANVLSLLYMSKGGGKFIAAPRVQLSITACNRWHEPAATTASSELCSMLWSKYSDLQLYN